MAIMVTAKIMPKNTAYDPKKYSLGIHQSVVFIGRKATISEVNKMAIKYFERLYPDTTIHIEDLNYLDLESEEKKE